MIDDSILIERLTRVETKLDLLVDTVREIAASEKTRVERIIALEAAQQKERGFIIGVSATMSLLWSAVLGLLYWLRLKH